MIWDKIAFLRVLFPDKAAAGEVTKRWFMARSLEPELAADLIRMGGVLVAQPKLDGEVVSRDAFQLAYEAGRRDLALDLIAMMQLQVFELNSLMEDNDVSSLEE